MRMGKKVSFIVIYYNQENFVKQSLQSVIDIEKNYEWEILVGDDGSTDNTVSEVKKMIKKYPDKVQLFVMERSEDSEDAVVRASANRLNLVRHSTGDFFCMLDGDDYYVDKTFVSRALKIFCKNPSISVVAFQFKTVGSCDKVTSRIKKNGYISTSDYIRNYYIHAGACVFRNIFDGDRLNYIESLGFFDDNDIVINNLNYGNMYVVNKIVYAYRQTGKSVFTKMTAIEKNILNLQGYDCNKLLLQNYTAALNKKYASPIIELYFFKKKLLSYMDETYIERKKVECSGFKNSLTVKLLSYCELPYDGQRKVDTFVISLMIMNPRKTIGAFLRSVRC